MKKPNYQLEMKDDFDKHFEELLYKGFIEQVGTDEPDGKPKYCLTPEALVAFDALELKKATASILKNHGKK